ncbi:MAG: type I-E CRISPR-associated protein Cas6/Cse3/CasE [Spirochaetes bacterium]|jgi:CRISPR system Cascade subunit CasE|nr:type I-E CRISPR-associated protein Cas6/Cse3/CasE [Spirochaetota bacterium]
MKYLSKAVIDCKTAARYRLFDVYAWHKAAWKAFPGEPDKTRDFLFRVDTVERGFRLFILALQEPMRPEWCPEDCWAVRELKNDFLDHNFYRFDIKANPTKKIPKTDDKGKRTKNGMRKALTILEDQINWFNRKAQESGFSVLDDPPLFIEPAQNYRFIKNQIKSDPGLHVGIRFQGVLEVIDREAFKKAFMMGIGSAKGFGFGMMVIQPLKLQ